MVNMDIEKLKSDLIRDEGLRLKPYKDTVGKMTIAVGHNITDAPLQPMFQQYVHDDGSIDRDLAMQVLEYDIDCAHTDLLHAFPWVLKLDEVRQRALCNMCFNMGIHVLQEFTNTMHLIESGEYLAAGTALEQSKWAHQVGKRAVRIIGMIEHGKDAA